MQRIILLSFLISLYSASATQCNIFDCANAQDKCYTLKPNGENFKYALGSCPEGQLCDLESDFDTGSCKSRLPMRLPGEFCTENGDCRSNLCEGPNGGKKCKGKDDKDGCNNDEDCNYGLYCATNKCTAVKKLDADCKAGEKCDAGLVCNLGKCTPIFSIPNEKEAGASSACETFFAHGGKCAVGPTLEKTTGAHKEPIKCENDCRYRFADNGDFITSSCVCGMTHEVKKYCNPGIGDIDLNDVFLHNLLV